MLESQKRLYFFIFLFSSFCWHILLFIMADIPPVKKLVQNKDYHQFKVKNIRIVGEDKGINEKFTYLQMKPKAKLKDLAIRPQVTRPEFNTPKKLVTQKAPVKKKINAVKMNRDDIKNFLKTPSPGYLTPSQALKALADTDVDIKLEVPKGIPEDELNKHELVFYSFQKRTALAYVNAFYKELNTFERQNPHLRFPLTAKKKKLAGRIVYDKDGNIIRIKTLQWTQIRKLDSFFEEVLKNMNSLPNPPKEILENDQFAVNFVLTLNQ